MKFVKWFLAGAIAVPFGHQIILWALNAVAYTSRKPFSMAPTDPYGVPSVISLSFWGGVWGIVLGLLLSRARGAAYWAIAIAFGAIAPTLVAGLVIPPLKDLPIRTDMDLFILGALLNGAWGFVTAFVVWLFNKK